MQGSPSHLRCSVQAETKALTCRSHPVVTNMSLVCLELCLQFRTAKPHVSPSDSPRLDATLSATFLAASLSSLAYVSFSPCRASVSP